MSLNYEYYRSLNLFNDPWSIEVNERITWDYMKTLLKKSCVFFDIGCQKGIYTKGVLDCLDNDCEVHSFDVLSHPEMEEIDKQNSNVIFNNVALGNGEETPCIISYNIPVEVISPTITLDSYVKENKISKIDFIKIDADGVQNEIIQGSKYVLDNMNPIIMIEMNMNVRHQGNFSGDEYVRRVKSSGHLDNSSEGVMVIPKSSEFTVTPDDNKLIEDMQSHGYYVDCVYNGHNVFFTKNGGNQPMTNELPTIDEFLENAQLKSYDNYHKPAYYDEEFRDKTVELSEKFDSNIFIETGSFDGRNVVVLNAMEIFEHINTIECVEEQYNNLVIPNTKGFKNIHCHLGDSSEVIGEILHSRSKDDKFFIFIDAHSAVGSEGWDMLPLEKELETIYRSNVKDPVIAIHDFYCPMPNGQRRFPNAIANPYTNEPIRVDDISGQLDKIYGKDEWVVEFSTKSDIPLSAWEISTNQWDFGGTGLAYFYKKL
tara:strand:+ start:268 stop:1719 length:1452 start_codon:yes stop_codon:yes gene_type:complete